MQPQGTTNYSSLCLSGVSIQARATSCELALSLHHHTFYQLGKEPRKTVTILWKGKVLTESGLGWLSCWCVASLY